MIEYKDYLRKWFAKQKNQGNCILQVMTICEVSHTTAWRWLNGKHNPQKGQRKLISKLFKLSF